MQKPIVAIDIDDVLASTAEALVEYSNQRWGTHLTIEDYQEHWGVMWKLEHDPAEMERRADEVQVSGVFGRPDPKPEAYKVLKKLHMHFRIVLVTSRRRQIEQETTLWIQKYFNGLVDDILFAGIYDRVDGKQKPLAHRLSATKRDILRELSPSYFIDDQPKHCQAAAELGIPTILFGNYPWNKDEKLSEHITRCMSWKDVETYFRSIRADLREI